MLRPGHKLAVCAAFLAAVAAPAPSRAQQPSVPAPVRFDVRPWPDAAILGLGVALSVTPLLLSDSVASPCPCDVGGLWGVDTRAVGPVAVGSARASNVTLLATYGLAGLSLVLSRPAGETEARLEDLTVLTEAVVVTSALTQVAKLAAGRPRPYLYDAQTPGRVARDDVMSFPSGHASTAFAAAAGYWSILDRRGEAGRHTPEIVGLFALATATAALRVSAHKHFPTDVVVGAVLGTAVGWLLPQMHRVR